MNTGVGGSLHTVSASAGLIRTIRSLGTGMAETVRDRLFGKTGLLSPFCAATSLTFGKLKDWKFEQIASPPLMRHIGRNLVKLAVGECNLTGAIPNAIGDHCVNLTWIYLASNPGITGRIPDNWSNLSKLQRIYLQRTGISGELPEYIGQLTKLEVIELHTTNLSGKIPKSWVNLTKLESIGLHDTKVVPPAGATRMQVETPTDCAKFLKLLM